MLIDGRPVGRAYYGISRQDVAAALPDWPESLRSGYLFNCPPRMLKEGLHTATIRVAARNGETDERAFSFTVRLPEGDESHFRIRRRMPRAEFDLHMDVLDRMVWRPRFHLLMPLRQETDIEAAAATLAALRSQPYKEWQLFLVTHNTNIETLVGSLADTELVEVIGPALLERTFGADAPDGLFVLVCPGDLPSADALTQLAIASGVDRDADFFSCDEMRVSPASGELEPFHKPEFSPDLLLHTNYIGRFWCARGSLLARTGFACSELLSRGEYDLILRCTESACRVRHIPLLLCRRGPREESADVERAALMAAAKRRGISAIVSDGRVPRSYRLSRTEPLPGLVSVIIPTCAAGGHIRTCIETLRRYVGERRIEIICIENTPHPESRWKQWLRGVVDRVITTEQAFNWSRFNNLCAATASGEFLLFLNDDIEITEPGWLDTMLDELANPGVGIVGPQLLYPDGRVQHAGMFLAELGLARHAFRFNEANDPGYFGLALTTRNVIAVTGACMLVRRALFLELGGFDEAHEIINNDLDFCLRAREAGHAIVYTPHVSLTHHEAASCGSLPDQFDEDRFQKRWQPLFLRGDPFSSPCLARGTDIFAPEEEPVQVVCAGHPLFAREEIMRILVVKLDHIGDFLTAVPALQRLRKLFPHARVTILCSQTVGDFARTMGVVDGFIVFEFFHARSGLGQMTLSASDFATLRARLEPEQFDLAIDLRKHLETREVLRYTGARFLAGYDSMGRFDWLDIALEWAVDQSMLAKRSHVSDDLLNLVEAIATASSPDRGGSLLPTTTRDQDLEFLPRETHHLFQKPVVCVHVGVGSVMRQWPSRHFAHLIDMLVADCGVSVVLIGGQDEQDIAEQILGSVAEPAALCSLVGRIPLTGLAAVIGACALFVGNDSGPKHIAAALGVPTIGIHSGSVDATEWAPVGKRAVAIRRKMTCSPCYLVCPEDCYRQLACLTGLEPAAVFAACVPFLGLTSPKASGTAVGR